MTMAIKDLIDIFSALLTPVIAILAAYIAWQQYRLQHKSFNAQMYERRYIVFKAFMGFFSQVMRDGKTTYPQLGQFYAEASEADFLFSDAISKIREEIYSRGIDMATNSERIYPSDGSPGLPIGDERPQAAKENGEHLKWFMAQIRNTKDSFKAEMRT
jgi:hypothetical protein